MSGAKVTLKLTGGERYGCPAVGEDTIVKGSKITVDAELADKLLEDSWFDASNNEHEYWTEVDPDEAAEAGDPDSKPAEGGEGGEDGEGEVKTKPAGRTRNKPAK